MTPRVVVTRDEAPDGPLAAALARHGLVPLPCPVVAEADPLDPAPLARAALALERYDWLIVASRRAVERLFAARAGRTLETSLRTAAVGVRTAEALAHYGATQVVTATEPGARALAATLAREVWSGRRVLMPRAEEGSTEIAEALRARGAVVEEVVAYRTRPRDPAAIRAAWPTSDPDAAIVASPSAARALIAGVGRETLARLRALIAIGATTAAALAEARLAALVPPAADFESTAALAAERLRAHDLGPETPGVRPSAIVPDRSRPATAARGESR